MSRLPSSIRNIKQKSQENNRRMYFLGTGIILLFIVNVVFSLYLYKNASSIPPQSSQNDVHALALSISKACQHLGDWKNCYGARFSLLARTNELSSTLRVLQEVKQIDKKVYDCHIPAHKIMGEYVTKDVSKWEEYINLIDPNDCTYGFIHGILEARAQEDGNFVLNEQTIPPFCQLLAERKKGRGVEQTCAHIIGHLVLTQEYGNIPAAVAICEKVPEHIQRECFGGLFMENYTRDNLVVHGVAEYIPWNEKTLSDQETMCNTYTGNVGLGCWQQMSNLYTVFYHNDPERVYERCTRAFQMSYTDMCYIQSMVAFMEIQNPTKEYYASLCARYEAQPGNYDMCTSYAIGSLIHASINLVDKAFLYCESAPGNYQPLCYSRLGEAMSGRLSYEKQVALCKPLAGMLQEACLTRGGTI